MMGQSFPPTWCNLRSPRVPWSLMGFPGRLRAPNRTGPRPLPTPELDSVPGCPLPQHCRLSILCEGRWLSHAPKHGTAWTPPRLPICWHPQLSPIPPTLLESKTGSCCRQEDTQSAQLRRKHCYALSGSCRSTIGNHFLQHLRSESLSQLLSPCIPSMVNPLNLQPRHPKAPHLDRNDCPSHPARFRTSRHLERRLPVAKRSTHPKGKS
mmetsp:Transcript_42553/g.99821  ORF Transcript_42553/g.99821 Transcript_42553/m.99821 type:complete len:209 (+) Transcript_42553:2284-2910(+)